MAQVTVNRHWVRSAEEGLIRHFQARGLYLAMDIGRESRLIRAARLYDHPATGGHRHHNCRPVEQWQSESITGGGTI